MYKVHFHFTRKAKNVPTNFNLHTSKTARKKLLDQYRDILRIKHYSPRTEDTYIQWVRNYILFHNKRHPKEMGVPEIGSPLLVSWRSEIDAHNPQVAGFLKDATRRVLSPLPLKKDAMIGVFLIRIKSDADERGNQKFHPRQSAFSASHFLFCVPQLHTYFVRGFEHET